MPSGFEPILACGSENVVDGSARTRSNSGSMDTAIPEVNPVSPQTRTFGKAASDIRKFLQRKD